jgi:Phosphotransferase enzyme family
MPGYEQVVREARTWTGDDRAGALAPLTGPWSNRLFTAVVDERPVIVKLYADASRDEPQREWEALNALAPSGAAAEPLHLAADHVAPAIVIGVVDGEARPFGGLDERELEQLEAVHRLVHATEPAVRRPANGHPAHIVAHTTRLFDALGVVATAVERPTVVVDALRRGNAWLQGAAAGLPTRFADGEVWCRGDTNAANYLWSDGVVRLIDFEDAGWRHPVFEVVELVEHVGNRDLSANQIEVLCDAWGATSAAVLDGRRLAACFWLAVVEQRARAGGQPRQVTPEQQAQRVDELLG